MAWVASVDLGMPPVVTVAQVVLLDPAAWMASEDPVTWLASEDIMPLEILAHLTVYCEATLDPGS